MFAIINNNHTNFKSSYLHPVDIKYKQSLQLELKKSYGINCKLSDLSSIAGPIETRSIINLLKSKNYKVGKNFRANFHIHTNASDGRFTPQEFLDACVDWANNIFKHMLEQSPLNVNLLLNSAKCYEKMNNKDAALETLDKIVEAFPECEEAQEMIRAIS